MQQIETTSATAATERKRVESVVETLATLRSEGESVAEIAHDARNMVTALGLYCELLEELGVLAPAFAHYAGELRLVAAASRKLVEKMVALDDSAKDNVAGRHSGLWRGEAPATGQWPARLPFADRRMPARHWDPMPSSPVADLAAELLATRNLLAALSGPSIELTLEVEGGAQPARIAGEDLTRVLVNLVKNAVEAMPSGGRINVTLHEENRYAQIEQNETGQNQTGPNQRLNQQTPHDASEGGRRWLVLGIEDNGPGIPAEALENIFESGYTEHDQASGRAGLGAVSHRGLGLAISRSIVEAAGGRIYAENRTPGGARLVIELPTEGAGK